MLLPAAYINNHSTRHMAFDLDFLRHKSKHFYERISISKVDFSIFHTRKLTPTPNDLCNETNWMFTRVIKNNCNQMLLAEFFFFFEASSVEKIK